MVLVGLADLLDQAMYPEAFEQARNLPAVEMRQEAAQRFVLQPTDVELAAQDGLKQGVIVGVEEVEAGIGTAFLGDGLGEFIQLVPPVARILEGGQELQVAPIGGFQQLAQSRQAVDGLPQGSLFGFFASVPVFYLAVVLEKGDIVDRGLDPENQAELVVELERHRPHGVFDPRAFDADVVTVAGFVLILRVSFFPKRSRCCRA